MSYKLKLSRVQAFDYINDLLYEKSQESKTFDFVPNFLTAFGFRWLAGHVAYELDDKLSVTEGLACMRNTDGIFRVKVGVRDLKLTNNDGYVNDGDFAKVIWVICHEAEHVRQCNNDFRQNSVSLMTKQQAVEALAIHGNDIFYKNFHNYERNTNEIQAEYAGFSEMVSFLHNEFDYVDSADIDNIAVNLVNKQCERDYFLSSYGSDFHSVDEIMGAFEDAYINAFDHMQEYPIPGTPVFNRLFGDINSPDCKNNDVLAKCLAGDEKLRTVFANAVDRSEQLSIMASVTKRVYPSFGDSYKCLNDVDLSYKHLVEDKYAKIMQNKSPTRQSVNRNNRPLPDISDIKFDSSDEDDMSL